MTVGLINPKPKIEQSLIIKSPFSYITEFWFNFPRIGKSKTELKIMTQFWKPGTEKPRLLEDEDGGVIFLSSSYSSSSSGCVFFHYFLFNFCSLIVLLLSFLFLICFSLFYRYGYVSIEKQRLRLPVYKYKTAIHYLVESHATTIVVGETGSGKTTQIPQVFSPSFSLFKSKIFNCLLASLFVI